MTDQRMPQPGTLWNITVGPIITAGCIIAVITVRAADAAHLAWLNTQERLYTTHRRAQAAWVDLLDHIGEDIGIVDGEDDE